MRLFSFYFTEDNCIFSTNKASALEYKTHPILCNYFYKSSEVFYDVLDYFLFLLEDKKLRINKALGLNSNQSVFVFFEIEEKINSRKIK